MTSRLGISARSTLPDHLTDAGPTPSVPRRHGRSPGALVAEVEKAGLRGRGGGWFPTHLKLRAVVESSAGRGRFSRSRHPVVIANGMEGEPACGKDALLLRMSPHLVLDGIMAAAATVGATDAFIAVHRDSAAIPVLVTALAEREEAGLDPFPVRLVTPPARYVASEESALARWVGDGIAAPVHPDRPFERGAADRPTLVQNVETLAHLALIARHGAGWFASVGTASAPGTMLVTVGGSVAHPRVLEVETGLPVAELVSRCGGVTQPVRGFLTGGYGGTWFGGPDLLGATWDPDSIRAAGGAIGASLLWVLGEDTCPLDELQRVSTWMAGESAGQCGPCVLGLPAVAADVRTLALRTASGEDLARLGRRLQLVSGRGGCKHPDGVARFVASGLAAFPDEVTLHLSGRCSVAGVRSDDPVSALPVPATRLAVLDLVGRDFR